MAKTGLLEKPVVSAVVFMAIGYFLYQFLGVAMLAWTSDTRALVALVIAFFVMFLVGERKRGKWFGS